MVQADLVLCAELMTCKCTCKGKGKCMQAGMMAHLLQAWHRFVTCTAIRSAVPWVHLEVLYQDACAGANINHPRIRSETGHCCRNALQLLSKHHTSVRDSKQTTLTSGLQLRATTAVQWPRLPETRSPGRWADPAAAETPAPPRVC